MSALDQAFIKAYSQQNPALAAAAIPTSKKSSEPKEPVKAAVTVASPQPASLATGAGKVVQPAATSAVPKGHSKRKAKSPAKAASDSVFEAMDRTSAKETTATKATKTKKPAAVKATKTSTPSSESHPARSTQKKAAKPAKTEPVKTSAMPPAINRSNTDLTYRLDLSPTTSGGADSPNARPAVPPPHTDVIFTARDSSLLQRNSSPNQATPSATESLSETKANMAKQAAKLAAQESAAGGQLPPAFSDDWMKDFTRSLSNLDSGTAVNQPEPIPEPEVEKTPAEIFEQLSASMKQYNAARQAPLPLPEKKMAREEPPAPNKSVSAEKKSFAAKPPAAEPQSVPAIRLFQPMLQVDHFAWPKVCGRLENGANAEIDRVVETLMAAQMRGKKSFILGGCQSGDGATSLLLAAARRMATREMKVVLVEADWSQPQLARRLGLLPQYGWEDVLLGRLPLEEVLIESIAERLVILPVREPFSAAELPAEAASRLVESWNSLRHHFDMVLVDSGPLSSSPVLDPQYTNAMASRIDATLLVKNLRQQDQNEFDAVGQALNNAGAKVLGIVENFAG
jgi:Mrp family chromosome partitioning ATPase